MIEQIKNATRATILLGLLSLIPIESQGQQNNHEFAPETVTEKVTKASLLSRNINGILTHIGKESFTYTDPTTHSSVTISVKPVFSDHDKTKEEYLVRSSPTSTLAFTAQAGAGLFNRVDLISKKNTAEPVARTIRIDTKHHEIITPGDEKKYSLEESQTIIEGYSARFLNEYQALFKALKDSTHSTDAQAEMYATKIESDMVPAAQRHEKITFIAGSLGDAASRMIPLLEEGNNEIDRVITTDDGTLVKVRYATGTHPIFMISEEINGGIGSIAYELDPKTYELISFANLNSGETPNGGQPVFPTAYRISGDKILDITSDTQAEAGVPNVQQITSRAKRVMEKVVTHLINL